MGRGEGGGTASVLNIVHSVNYKLEFSTKQEIYSRATKLAPDTRRTEPRQQPGAGVCVITGYFV